MRATILAVLAAISIGMGVVNTAAAGNFAAPVHEKSQFGTSEGGWG